MQQESLFDNDKEETPGTQTPATAIYSARVGAIRFGATELSFALTREALIDLTAPRDEGDEDAS